MIEFELPYGVARRLMLWKCYGKPFNIGKIATNKALLQLESINKDEPEDTFKVVKVVLSYRRRLLYVEHTDIIDSIHCKYVCTSSYLLSRI